MAKVQREGRFTCVDVALVGEGDQADEMVREIGKMNGIKIEKIDSNNVKVCVDASELDTAAFKSTMTWTGDYRKAQVTNLSKVRSLVSRNLARPKKKK